MKAWEGKTVTPEEIAATFTNGYKADRVEIIEQDEHAVIYTVFGMSKAANYVASKHNDFDMDCGSIDTLQRVYNTRWGQREIFA